MKVQEQLDYLTAFAAVRRRITQLGAVGLVLHLTSLLFMVLPARDLPAPLLVWQVGFGISVLLLIYVGATWTGMRSRIKHSVFKAIVAKELPGYKYEPDRAITRQVFEKSRLYPVKPFRYKGEDWFYLPNSPTRLRFCEVRVQFYGQKLRSHLRFDGFLFEAELPVPKTWSVVAIPATFENVFFSLQTLTPNWEKAAGAKTYSFNDVKFQTHYETFASSPEAAEAVLAAQVRDALLHVDDRLGCKPARFSVVDGRAYLACHFGYAKDYFEPPSFVRPDLVRITNELVGQIKRLSQVESLFAELHRAATARSA